MPDAVFADPRLAELYDLVEGDRSDLNVYAALVEEFGARRVLDVGCGTGTFACLLAARDLEVFGIDPAAASLDVARRKPNADRVGWLHGDAASVAPVGADLATMTGNVAQVFLSEGDWLSVLAAIRAALHPGGALVFEARDPARRDWENWNRELTHQQFAHPALGRVRTWIDLTEVQLPFVSFRQVFEFASDDSVLVSTSTLRFRDLDEITESLVRAGMDVVEVRDAPDRPGLEFRVHHRTAGAAPRLTARCPQISADGGPRVS